MELLNARLFLMNNLKIKKLKSGETHARISQKNFTATDRQTENSQKISLFQIFLKIECSRVPIHFKVAAAGTAHPLRDQKIVTNDKITKNGHCVGTEGFALRLKISF